MPAGPAPIDSDFTWSGSTPKTVVYISNAAARVTHSMAPATKSKKPAAAAAAAAVATESIISSQSAHDESDVETPQSQSQQIDTEMLKLAIKKSKEQVGLGKKSGSILSTFHPSSLPLHHPNSHIPQYRSSATSYNTSPQLSKPSARKKSSANTNSVLASSRRKSTKPTNSNKTQQRMLCTQTHLFHEFVKKKKEKKKEQGN